MFDQPFEVLALIAVAVVAVFVFPDIWKQTKKDLKDSDKFK